MDSVQERVINDYIVSVTGHRFWKDPEKERDALLHGTAKLVGMLEQTLKEPAEIVLIHGCATGVDLWFGEIAMKLGRVLELYLPFPRITQMVRGKMTAEQRYSLDTQIEYAEKVVICSQKFYYYGYQKRNVMLVDRCHMLASYYTRGKSGSGNAVRTAELKKKPVVDLRTIMNLVGFDDSIHHLDTIL
jgi:hypothetical protein